jgi:hypothetical protein
MMGLSGRFLSSAAVFQAPDAPKENDERIEVDTEEDTDTNDPQEEDPGEPESEDESGADETDEAEAQPPAPPGEPRGRRQFGELRATNRRLAQDNAELTRRMAELEGRVNSQQNNQQQWRETPQQREARLSQLSDGERARVELAEYQAADQYRFAEFQRQNFESSDRVAFSSLQQSSALAKRFAPQVERVFQEQMRQGRPVDRDTIFSKLLGDHVRAQEGKPKKRAAENRERQQARPVRAGSDVRAARGRAAPNSAADFEERFGDVPI